MPRSGPRVALIRHLVHVPAQTHHHAEPRAEADTAHSACLCGGLREVELLERRVDGGRLQHLVLELPVLHRNRSQLQFFRGEGGGVHALVEHLDRQLDHVLELHVVLVLLLEDRLRRLVVCADCRGFPAAVVARRVALVQLETKVLVPARPQKRYAERPQPSKLSVSLLSVTDVDDELLDRNGLLICQGVALGSQTCVVDQDVGIGGDSRHSAGQMVINLVHLLA
mmetsp:Transcript_18571/g.37742  ORF Transcript_18571/g.37742 Transcript_18571/m.37742 type:complete len:225 (+) Transcript_18571:176-850(+)